LGTEGGGGEGARQGCSELHTHWVARARAGPAWLGRGLWVAKGPSNSWARAEGWGWAGAHRAAGKVDSARLPAGPPGTLTAVASCRSQPSPTQPSLCACAPPGQPPTDTPQASPLSWQRARAAQRPGQHPCWPLHTKSKRAPPRSAPGQCLCHPLPAPQAPAIRGPLGWGQPLYRRRYAFATILDTPRRGPRGPGGPVSGPLFTLLPQVP
jgi:hypothetical protein